MGSKKGGHMGQSEQLASVAAGLFHGHIDEDDIFPFPGLDSGQKEMATAMIDAIVKYAQDSIDSAKLDLESQIPEEVSRSLSEMGLMGVGVPEQYGGLGLDQTLNSRIFSTIAATDASIAALLGAHQSIGYKALLLYGSDQQKEKYLPRLASGEMVASFCLTESGSGSDAYSIQTKAVQNDDGTYTINGQKLWITNGGTADFYTVFCKTDHQVEGENKEKISCFIVEKGMPGLSFGEKEKKMGIRASETRAVFFDQVKVPAENMIGGPGKGFKIAMNVLNSGRLTLASGCVGAMQYMLKLATHHAANRKQFKQKLTSFGLIQEKLARMAANTYAAESLVYYVTGRIDRGQQDYSLESAICKVFCSERLWETVDMALQIAGGTGYMQEYPYERLMRDSRINLIFEGTNEILRVFIALSGMHGPGEALKDVGRLAADVTKALLDPIKSTGILTTFAKGRIDKMMAKTLSRCHSDLSEHSSNMSKMLSSFATEVENILFKYSTNIIGNELPQKRVADMAISLMAMVCLLSRTTSILDNSEVNEEMKAYVVDITDMAMRDQRHRFMAAYRETSSNLDRQIKRITERVEGYGGRGFDIINF